jgi:adenylylsulfate kinase
MSTGFVVWFTGLSGAGKSTLATALQQELAARGQRVEVLDGDEVRTNLSKGLGFSKEDRDTNIRRIGYVARLLGRNDVGVITAAISPYRAVRDEVRALVEGDGVEFIEVYASCSIEELTRRDVKGLYARALRGELPNFTGVSDPYEEPLNPEVLVNSDQEDVETSHTRIVSYLQERGLLAEREAVPAD